MKKYPMSKRLLTLKNNTYMELRTSYTQPLEKGCQHGEEYSKNKILS